MQVNISDNIRIINRETKDILQALSDFGGLFGILNTIFLFLFSGISQTKLNAVFANSFFTWEQEDANDVKVGEKFSP